MDLAGFEPAASALQGQRSSVRTTGPERIPGDSNPPTSRLTAERKTTYCARDAIF